MNGMTAIYMRVSTDDQRLDSQQRELKRYCQHRGWTNLHFYADKLSGSKASRPALDEMIADLRGGKLERLIVYKLDRLGRSLIHLALILDELSRTKVPLICTSQGIDTSDDNPAGKLQLGVLMAVAEFERGIIRERVNAGLAAAKDRGVKLGRPPKLRARAPEVMKLKGQGLGIRAIARTLEMPVSSVHSVVEWSERGWAAVKEPAAAMAEV
jgi:DNA invertase Pin-like site-specific DNA recombinase